MKWSIPQTDTYFAPILNNSPEGFEIDHLKYALKFCKGGRRTAVDGGAHIGTWSKYLAQFFNHVMAFEPAQDTMRCLAENTEAFQNISRYRVALGERGGTCGFQDDPARPGNTGARYVTDNTSGETIIASLDSFGITTLDFLKLDLEGGELHALRGAYGTIQRSWPVIVVECKAFDPPRHGGPAEVKRWLFNMGYKEVGGIRNDRVFTR